MMLAAAATQPNDWLNPALITSIIVAVIGAVGLGIVAKLRKPITIQDLWAENRSLRSEMGELRDDQSTLEEKFELRDKDRLKKIATLGAGVDVLWHFIERLRDRWGKDETFPTFTEDDYDIITRAREVRASAPDPAGEYT